MTITLPIYRREWRAVAFLICCLFLEGGFQSRAHDSYTAFVQHRVRLSVGKERLDVTIDLTFFEEWSLRERRRMDTDSNGRLERAEINAYLKSLAPELTGQIGLRVASRPVPLELLYEPEVDLLGNDQAKPGHHRLTLYLFAPEPPRLNSGDVLVLEDRLWPGARSLTTLRLDAADGCELEPARQPSYSNPSTSGEAGLSIAALCKKPPASISVDAGQSRKTLPPGLMRH